MGLVNKAKAQWEEVNLARGKGRLAREKAAKVLVLDDETGAVVQPGLPGALAGAVVESAGDVSPAAREVIANELLGG